MAAMTVPTSLPVLTRHPVDLALRRPRDVLAIGQLRITQALLAALGGPEGASQLLAPLLLRHARCDWSSGDPRAYAQQRAEIEAGLPTQVHSDFSVTLPDGRAQSVWIITEADRSVTTALRPDDY